MNGYIRNTSVGSKWNTFTVDIYDINNKIDNPSMDDVDLTVLREEEGGSIADDTKQMFADELEGQSLEITATKGDIRGTAEKEVELLIGKRAVAEKIIEKSNQTVVYQNHSNMDSVVSLADVRGEKPEFADLENLTPGVVTAELYVGGVDDIIVGTAVSVKRGSEPLNMEKCCNLSIEEAVDKIQEICEEHEYSAGFNDPDMSIDQIDDYLVVDTELFKFGFVKIDDDKLVFADKRGWRIDSDQFIGSGYYYPPNGNDVNRVPDKVLEYLSDNGYVVYKNVDSGWSQWNGRPEFSESYVDLSDALKVN